MTNGQIFIYLFFLVQKKEKVNVRNAGRPHGRFPSRKSTGKKILMMKKKKKKKKKGEDKNKYIGG
jgi:hypothetical protein